MKKILTFFGAFVLLFSVTACGAKGSDTLTGTQKAYIIGEDWGPAVSKTIITLDYIVDADSLDIADFAVEEVKEAMDWSTYQVGEGKFERTITAVYLSDEKGEKSDSKTGKIVTIEMAIDPNTGSPFIYSLATGANNWVAYYKLNVTLAEGGEIKSGGKVVTALTVTPEIDVASADARVVPIADEFAIKEYEAKSGTKYAYGEYVPTQGEGKRPLVIWLHGAGEGGNDNYIDLLGNEVTALAGKEFQDIMKGAYVITPQSPTMWMNDGTGTYTSGAKPSMYTEDLMELIEAYVAGNDNVDTSKIIIGGCSNGGYMTINMIIHYPEYFAAAYPICEAYTDIFITDDQIKALVDNKVGIWFTHSENDGTVAIAPHTLATFDRLIAAGHTNVHKSIYKDVADTTGNYKGFDGNPHQYFGHWSWIYFFNNTNVEGNLNCWSWLAEQSK